METCGYNTTSYPKYTNNIPQNKKKVYLPREDYKMLHNYFLPEFPVRDNHRRGRDTLQGGMGMRMKMKNNVNMRKLHRIQQPGFDVQRRYHK